MTGINSTIVAIKAHLATVQRTDDNDKDLREVERFLASIEASADVSSRIKILRKQALREPLQRLGFDLSQHDTWGRA